MVKYYNFYGKVSWRVAFPHKLCGIKSNSIRKLVNCESKERFLKFRMKALAHFQLGIRRVGGRAEPSVPIADSAPPPATYKIPDEYLTTPNLADVTATDMRIYVVLYRV